MIRSRRALLYVALALCVPLPAFALGGEREGDAPAPEPFSVSVALDRCALLEAEILCKLDLGFDSVDGAIGYTATVTRPDGSVLDLGEIGAGPASVWVPYAGNGTYAVEVAAYGEPDEPEGEPKLLDRQRGEVDDAEAGESDGEPGSTEAPPEAEPPGEPEADKPEAAGPDGGQDADESGDGPDAVSPAPTCAEDGDGDEGGEADGEAGGGDRQAERDEAGADTINPCPR